MNDSEREAHKVYRAATAGKEDMAEQELPEQAKELRERVIANKFLRKSKPFVQAQARRKAEAEEEAKRKAQEAAAKQKAEQEAAAKQKAEQEAAAKQKAEQEAAAKQKAEQEAKRKAEQEAKQKADEAARPKLKRNDSEETVRSQSSMSRRGSSGRLDAKSQSSGSPFQKHFMKKLGLFLVYVKNDDDHPIQKAIKGGADKVQVTLNFQYAGGTKQDTYHMDISGDDFPREADIWEIVNRNYPTDSKGERRILNGLTMKLEMDGELQNPIFNESAVLIEGSVHSSGSQPSKSQSAQSAASSAASLPKSATLEERKAAKRAEKMDAEQAATEEKIQKRLAQANLKTTANLNTSMMTRALSATRARLFGAKDQKEKYNVDTWLRKTNSDRTKIVSTAQAIVDELRKIQAKIKAHRDVLATAQSADEYNKQCVEDTGLLKTAEGANRAKMDQGCKHQEITNNKIKDMLHSTSQFGETLNTVIDKAREKQVHCIVGSLIITRESATYLEYMLHHSETDTANCDRMCSII